VSVGQALAEARAQRGHSVEDVSAATRIRSGLIRDIEADDFHACGGDVYARGHIRSIARFLGIDAAPLIAEFDATHHVEPPVVAPAPPETDREALAHSERRSPNWAAAMVVALLAVIAIAAYSAFGTGTGNSKQPSTNAQQHNSLTSKPSVNSKSSVGSHKPPPGSVASVQNPHKAVLQIRATTAESWLQVRDAVSGATLFEGNLLPGQQKRFVKGYPLSFVIGNAPAVDVVVNGKDIGSPQSSGNVARGKITPGSRQIQPA